MPQQSILDTAGFVDILDETIRRQSLPEQGMVLTTPVGGLGTILRQQYRLRWDPATAAQVVALRLHYDQTRFAAFQYYPPGEATAVDVIYFSAPRIQWRTAAAATATVTLERAIARD